MMARLDTGWHAHPKVLALGWAAMGLHAWSISYCDDTLSDGFVPTNAWPALPGWSAALKRLVGAGLWTPCEGGYQLHDYTDYNRTRAEVADYMRAKRDAGRAGGLAKAKAHARANGTADALAPATADALAKGLAKSYTRSRSPVNLSRSPATGGEGLLGEGAPSEMPHEV